MLPKRSSSVIFRSRLHQGERDLEPMKGTVDTVLVSSAVHRATFLSGVLFIDRRWQVGRWWFAGALDGSIDGGAGNGEQFG